MRKNLKKIIIVIMVVGLVFNYIPTYGIGTEMEKRAYNLGFIKGIEKGAKDSGDIAYYRLMPEDYEILLEFSHQYPQYTWKDITEESRPIIENYMEGFREGYESVIRYENVTYTNRDEIIGHAKKAGSALGEIYGFRDYFNGKKSSWATAIPSSRTIREYYNLDKETASARSSFTSYFRDNFKNSYINAYRKANFEEIEIGDSQGKEDGEAIGKMKGEYSALIDVTSNKSNLWTRHRVKDEKLIEDYGLKYQSENYKTAFITSYWYGFMRAYDDKHKSLHMDNNKLKTHSEKIDIGGKIGIGILDDSNFLVDIEPGSFYNDIIITLDAIPDSHVPTNSKRYTPASPIYSFKILNPPATFDGNKEINIRFKSYGKDERYGIYKYHDSKWVYIPTVQEGEYLLSKINLANISNSGNIYRVFRNDELPIFYDIRGHWAKNEIKTCVKRELIFGYSDNSFRPDDKISRRDFLVILSRLFDWHPPFDSSNIEKFEDYKEFTYGEKAISYALYHNIIGGCKDNTFRPDDKISYKEVEIIMSRILKDKNFNWNYFANQMLYEYGVRSKSKNTMNNAMTRAELVFMIYKLNEWRY